MNIGTSIMKIRKQAGIDRKTLAERLEISTTALINIENNTSIPKKVTFEKLSEVLGVPYSYIHFMALETSDLPEEHQNLFNTLYYHIEESVGEKMKLRFQ
jgi:transcriptional regulator with XRE-family HTH domain